MAKTEGKGSVATAMAQTMKAYGVRFVFGIPGNDVLELIRACEAQDIRFILAKSEPSAGFMADAAAQLTGDPAACIFALGPGVVNGATGVAGALMERTPVIILGGIYTGIFTPTEAAVVAVFYSLFVAVVIYRTVTWRDMIRMLVDASVTASVIMFIVVFAGIFTWAASVIGVIDQAANFVIAISPNAAVMIILINLLLLGLGMILDAISISYLIMPILIPVLAAFKIDPLWYGVIFISALAIGQATPPVGVNLFTAANLVKGDLDSVARQAIVFVIMDVVILIILSLFPILSLYLPVLVGLYKL